EFISHYTGRSDGFVKIKGKWVPKSPIYKKGNTYVDGRSDKSMARKFREDIVASFERAENQSLLKNRRATWRNLRDLLENVLHGKESAKEKLWSQMTTLMTKSD